MTDIAYKSSQDSSEDHRVEIRGQKIDLGDSLPRHAREHLTETLDKYTDRATNAKVLFHKENEHLFACEIRVQVNKRVSLFASGKAIDPYAAFHTALTHAAKRLRRYKRRLREDHKHHDKVSEYLAQSYVLRASDEDNAFSSGDVASSESTETQTEEHLIVAESEDPVDVCSVADAVMRMELSGRDYLLFVETQSHRVNLVYRRSDGHFGWVDPKIDLPV